MTWAHHSPEHLGNLLDSITAASWRWECQGDYSAIDANLMQRWRDGLGRDPAEDQPWVDYIQRLRHRAIPFERARMLTDPLTEYLRCQLDVTDMNVDAGEDIRWVQEGQAKSLGLPTYDYYLFDNAQVAVLEYDGQGLFSGIRTSGNTRVVEQHQKWRDLIWPHAIPHRRYLATLAARKDQ